MCSPSWELVSIARSAQPRLAARLSDGSFLDLQAAHVALHGKSSPHLRDAHSFRLAAAYGIDLLEELVTAAPHSAIVPA